MPPIKSGFELWREDLKSACYVIAPMVDQSELAWRLLSRRHGAQLCYTPMLHASIFVRDARYRRENLVSCAEDRPLIVQFCANDPDTFLEACKLVVGQCEAVDLNLGCPQAIAKKGHYGAYLQDEWDLVYKMVNTVYVNLDIPVTCKIRIFEDVDKTVRYAKMLEKAGCQLLAVHGRTREQKGPHTGIASWDHIKAIKDNVSIPVFANGNIQYATDLEKCLRETNADGVMIAEGSLYNPTLLEGTHPKAWDIALEYLAIVKEHLCPMSYVRGHLFKLLHHCLQMTENKDIQEELAKAGTLEIFTSVIHKLRDRYKDCDGYFSDDPELPFQLPLPLYACQPYIRPGPVEQSKVTDKSKEKNPLTDDGGKVKREREGSANELSRRKLKKLLKNPLKKFGRAEEYVLCTKCCNPRGTKCGRSLCRSCCRSLCRSENLDCYGHKFLYKHKRVQLVLNNSAQQIDNCR